MTKCLRCFIFIFSLFAVFSVRAQSWEWERKAGSTANDVGLTLAQDKSSNLYLTGYFSDKLIIGSDTLLNAGGQDIFLAKYDSSGTLLWVRGAGGSGNDDGNALCVDDSNNVYVAGSIGTTAIFGSDTLTTFGIDDCFLAKYTPNGQLLWAKNMGGTGTDGISFLAIDHTGHLIINGTFSNTAHFDNDSVISKGGYDGFLASYTTNGHLLWLKSGGGTGDDYYMSLTIDAGNNILSSGLFTTSATFSPYVVTGNGSNPNNTFVSKFYPNGQIAWVEEAGGNGPAYGTSIACDKTGSSYVAGYFAGTIQFDTTSLVSAGLEDAFIAKYDANGKVKWAKRSGGPHYDYAFTVATDQLANAYITGYQGTVGNVYIYLAKYDSAGNFEWSKTAGGAGQINGGYGLIADTVHNLYLAGVFSSKCPFDTDNLQTSGGWDIFLAKITSPPDTDDLGIIELTKSSESIIIYPNPSTGSFTIENKDGEIKKLSVYNTLGQQITPAAIFPHQTSTHIDLSSQPAGIYFLQLKTGKGVATRKISKE